MKSKSTAILEYLYRQKTENGLNAVSLIELPNTDGINELYSKGYVTAEFNRDKSIRSLSLSGKGLDRAKENSMSDRQKILKFFYDRRTESSPEFTAGLDKQLNIEQPVLLAECKYLTEKGLLEKVGKGSMDGNAFLRITAFGVDEAESIGKPQKTLEEALLSAMPTSVSITSDVISIKIRSEIYGHIKTFLDSGHYFTAVEEAYKVVRDKLKSITGEEAAAAVFGENALNNKYWEDIFGSVPFVGTPEADFMRGTGYIHLGVQYLRNEKTHTTATSLDKNLALHYISLASLAYDLIDRHEEGVE